MNNPTLVNVTRGGFVESSHRGSIAVLDAEGAVVLALGDIERPIFPRSAVKLLQALPLVAGGVAESLGLTDEELALACASHNGEDVHAATAQAMLAKAGLDAGALECGAHWPYLDSAARALAAAGNEPSALHNNCSGKHAGFLCLACAMHGRDGLRGFARGYVGAEHPVMREVGAALAAATGFNLDHTVRGTDGCSIPTYAIPLRHLALGFARAGTGAGLSPAHARAAQRLRKAVARAPFMVAGTGRLDTRLMQRLGERVCCKVGAEGVYCAALPERGLGVAIKMDDGNNARAAEVAVAAVIGQALTLEPEDETFVRSCAEPSLCNWNGIEVGTLGASDALRRALPAIRP